MNLNSVKQLINRSEEEANKEKNSVTLVAVSKVQPTSKIEVVIKQGHRCFGENRVQEAMGKWPKLKEEYTNIDLHLIGALQTNKVRQAFELFDVIQSLDRIKLAKSIARLAQEKGKCPSLFIQVNTGAEPQKAGVLPLELDSFMKECRLLDLPIEGLMCIPPINEESALHFSLLRKMQAKYGLNSLSMGMSSDFEKAVLFGATHVRVGSALFGERISTP